MILLDFDPLTNYLKMINAFISEIRHMESEVVRMRYEWSRYLPKKERNLLYSDIPSNLGGRYAGDPAYNAFVQKWRVERTIHQE